MPWAQPKFFRGYVMSSPFVKTCLQRVNSIISTENSSTKILQRLRYVLSFCEDMSSKGKFHNLNRKFFRGYVMSSPFVKTCLQRINAMSSTKILQRLRYVLSFCEDMSSKGKFHESQPKILQRLRYVLSFCEDMSSKGKFHNLNRKFFRGYVMSSPFVKTCLQRVNSIISTENSSEVTLCPLLLWRHVFKG